MKSVMAKNNSCGRRLSGNALIVAISMGLVLAADAAAAGSDPAQHDMHNMHDMQGGMHDMHAMHHAAPMQHGVIARLVKSYDIPDVKLMDANHAEVSLHAVLDEKFPVILNFIYTSCTAICPVTTGTFEQVQRQLGDSSGKVRLVTISIDPENDTPARLKEYAARYHAGPQWTMLTGTVDNSIAVQRALGVYSGDKMNHKPVTFLRAKGSENPWVRLDGFASASEIIAELGKLTAK